MLSIENLIAWAKCRGQDPVLILAISKFLYYYSWLVGLYIRAFLKDFFSCFWSEATNGTHHHILQLPISVDLYRLLIIQSIFGPHFESVSISTILILQSHPYLSSLVALDFGLYFGTNLQLH